MPIDILRVGVKRMGPDSFQWCPAIGQGTTGTNWSIAILSELRKNFFILRVTQPWNRLPRDFVDSFFWRYSRPTWTQSCAACCRWPCFSRGVGLDDPQRSLSAPTILWCCEMKTMLRSRCTIFFTCILSCLSSILWCLLLNRSLPCSRSHRVGFFAHMEDFVLFECYITPTRLANITGLQVWETDFSLNRASSKLSSLSLALNTQLIVP